MDTKEILAGKIISKTMLTKPHQKEKVSKKKRRNSILRIAELYTFDFYTFRYFTDFLIIIRFM